MIKRFYLSESGAARSSMVFAAVMGLTAIAVMSQYSGQNTQQAQALQDLSGTQYLSSQKLQ
ncbi:hypothetical protein [Tropicimonas sp. S265A]|uniref:hypothetical protein n=1 Tax=Tropicimonas sp. S265A TaxID=3415134 RepID=UPI003C7D8647